MHYYDTHIHLDLLKDQQNVLSAIESHQIYTISMTNLPDLYLLEKQQLECSYIRLALGFHPELVAEYKSHIPLMWELLPEARYIGEVGLDFSTKDGRREQIDFFEDLINRCRMDSNKIMSIHSRNAATEIISIIGEDFKFKPILHWFSGKRNDLELAIKRGYYISINRQMLLTKKFQLTAFDIPINKLLIETDIPFVKSNDYLKTLQDTMEILGEKLGLDTEVIKHILWNNFTNLLGNRTKN